jgi:hypothetical protein
MEFVKTLALYDTAANTGVKTFYSTGTRFPDISTIKHFIGLINSS